jgi:hypothetical protein
MLSVRHACKRGGRLAPPHLTQRERERKRKKEKAREKERERERKRKKEKAREKERKRERLYQEYSFAVRYSITALLSCTASQYHCGTTGVDKILQ